ncbi:MAG: hypothetical protein U0270_04265 [Labilithrix sp.]
MIHWRTGAVLVGLVLVTGGLVQACGGSDGEAPEGPGGSASTLDSGTPPPVQTATKAAATVGNGGGKVTTTSGVGVEIPAGALPNDVQVSVNASPTSTPPAGATSLGTPHVFGPSGLQFTKPVTVVLEFDPAKLPPGKTAANIVVFTAPEGTLDYAPLPTKVRDATHVEAETTHFSVMVPAIPAEAVDAGTGDRDAGPACTPRLCGYYGPGTCGTQSDGCNAFIDCGQCSGGTDAGVDASTGDAGTCQNPLTCANYELAEGPICGQRDNGCGGKLDCTSGCASDAGADAGGGPVDAGGGADAGGGPVDAGGGADAGGGPVDAGGGGADAGGGPVDAGGGGADAGGGPVDAGGGADAGGGPVDAGGGGADAGGGGPVDAGGGGADAGGGAVDASADGG